MKVQDRVRARWSVTSPVGTVTKMLPDGSFRVTYDPWLDPQGRRRKGGRYEYREYLAALFVIIEPGKAKAEKA